MRHFRSFAIAAATLTLAFCAPLSCQQSAEANTHARSTTSKGTTAKKSAPTAKKAAPTKPTTGKTSAHTGASSKKRSRKKSARVRGQEKIDSERAQSIQEALIREHYLSGEATGQWNQASEEAMRRYQADNGWQSKTVPDSRALIKLGLGPSKDHLLNPDSAMTTVPDAPKADPLPTTSHTAPAVADPAPPTTGTTPVPGTATPAASGDSSTP